MANGGISGILSVLREGISSERQTRLAEMQMSLQALSAKAERDFQKETRQRENTLFSLKHAEDRTKESIAQDAGIMVTSLTSLMETSSGSSDRGAFLDFDDQSILHESGLSEADQRTAYAIVTMYGSDSESLQKLGNKAAVGFARRFANEYKVWAASGYSEATEVIGGETHPKYKGSLLSGMSGLVYLGADEVRRELAVEPYLMVAAGTDAIDRIYEEYDEIGQGDYNIQRDLSYSAEEGITEPNAEQLALLMLEAGFGEGDEGKVFKKAWWEITEPYEERMHKLGVTDQLTNLAREVEIKDAENAQSKSIATSALQSTENKIQDVELSVQLGDITRTKADSLLVILNRDIKTQNAVIDSLNKVQINIDVRGEVVLKERNERLFSPTEYVRLQPHNIDRFYNPKEPGFKGTRWENEPYVAHVSEPGGTEDKYFKSLGRKKSKKVIKLWGQRHGLQKGSGY